MKKQTSKGMMLYEQVLQKNFQIIQTFLNKFPLIFKKQDYFEQAIKKINEKLNKHENDQQKLQLQMNLSMSLLEKKMHTVKENVSRHSRSSIRASQQSIVDEKRPTNFRVSSAYKENKQTSSHFSFSKQKAELLIQIEKKQGQNIFKISALTDQVQKLSQKVQFLSTMTSKTQETTDNIIQSMVEKKQFDVLRVKFQEKFARFIQDLVIVKYASLQKTINEKFMQNIKNIEKLINQEVSSQRQKIEGKIDQKLGKVQFKTQVDAIKLILEKIVTESIEVFANKEQTKRVFMLFEKKVQKMQTVIQQIMIQTLGLQDQEHSLMNITRKNKDFMSSFGKKKIMTPKGGTF